jgi:hypothetical protein
MAIGLRIKFAGGTQQQYDAVHGHMEMRGLPRAGSTVAAAASPGESGRLGASSSAVEIRPKRA